MNYDNDLHKIIKDLTTSLVTVSTEFNTRVEQIKSRAAMRTLAADETGLYSLAEKLLHRQRVRLRYFSPDLFHDPAWNMLLTLYLSHHQKTVIHVKALIACSDTPATTSLRWIDHLHALGLVDRRLDMQDRRRVEVSLSEAGLAAITAYLQAIAAD